MQKYNLELDENLTLIETSVVVNDKLDTVELAQMIKEILNCVEIPTVVYPKKTDFSTGELNYFSMPEWGVFDIELYDESIHVTSFVRFYFEDKAEPTETLAARIDENIRETREWHEKYWKNSDCANSKMW